jgi:NitT/TauT family transport system permease protein
MHMTFKHAFLPYAPFSRSHLRLLFTVQAALAVCLWLGAAAASLPSPQDVARAWYHLAAHEGLLFELWESAKVLLLALAVSSVLALFIAALGTAPMFKPVAQLSSLLRFLGFAGLTYLFMLVTQDGYQLKLALLVFGMTAMMVTAMLAEVRAIPQQAIDHCKTLGMRHWRITWELAVLGKADTFLDQVRQNAAVGWTLLAMVEGLARSQGGIGAMLQNQNRYFQLAGVFAIQLTILLYGIVQDSLLGRLKEALCPYSLIGKEDNT